MVHLLSLLLAMTVVALTFRRHCSSHCRRLLLLLLLIIMVITIAITIIIIIIVLFIIFCFN